MRVLLVNPPSPERLGSPLLGLQYVAAALIASGVEVRVLDAAARGAAPTIPDIIREAESLRPDIIGMSLFTRWVWHAYRLVDELAYRHASGEIAYGPTAAPISDLDTLPPPYLAQPLFDPSWYGGDGATLGSQRCRKRLSIETTHRLDSVRARSRRAAVTYCGAWLSVAARHSRPRGRSRRLDVSTTSGCSLVPTGTALSPVDREPRAAPNEASRARDDDRGTKDAETGHLFIFVAITGLTVWALASGWWDTAGWLLLFNLLHNGYPVSR
jgi:hypothetical protein